MSDQRKPSAESGFRLAGALYGAEQAALQAAGADVMRQGMRQFLDAAQRLTAVPVAIKKGNLFEYLEAAKFNYDAARKGSSLVAEVSAALGDPTAPADIVLRRPGGAGIPVQAKVSESSTQAARMLANPKYDGMVKLVPRDKATRVKAYSAGLAKRTGQRGEAISTQYADTAVNVRGELALDDVRSGGTDLSEAIEATEGPRRYALKLSAGAIASEAVTAGAHAAVASGLLRGAIELAKVGFAGPAAMGGAPSAFAVVARGSVQSALHGGATATLATTMRHATRLPGLAKANVSTAMAAGLIDAGAAVYSFVKGELTPEELGHRLGQNGCGTLSGLYGGMVSGAALGPVGVLLGSLAGYLIATNTYQSCMAILERARLAEEESGRAVALLEAARRKLEEEKDEFEQNWRSLLSERGEFFRASLASIDDGLSQGDPEATLAGLSEFMGVCGLSLGFSDFESFDNFMCATDDPIVL